MRRPVRRLAFWGGVAGVSLLAPLALNVLADRLGPTVPGLDELNSYLTRRNG